MNEIPEINQHQSLSREEMLRLGSALARYHNSRSDYFGKPLPATKADGQHLLSIVREFHHAPAGDEAKLPVAAGSKPLIHH
jgi:hypothetical protein